MRSIVIIAFIMMVGIWNNGQVQAENYQWEDDQRVLHFTDNEDKIPAKYRKRVRQRVSSQSAPNPVTPVVAPPAMEQAIPQAIAAETLYDGQPVSYWQQRFANLKQMLSEARRELTDKQDALQRAHRAYVVSLGRPKEAGDQREFFALNTVGAKRKAYMDLQEEVKALEEKIKGLEANLATLQAEADAAKVPAEAR